MDVQLHLTPAHLYSYAIAFLGRHFFVTQRKKLGNSNVFYYKTKNHVGLQLSRKVKFLEGLASDETITPER